MDFSTLVGLVMVGGSLLVFAMGMPRGGRIRNEPMHTPLMMLLIAVLFVGVAFALMGFPEPMKLSSDKR
jgi:hypothetical protein